jgi:cytochrome c-type biogenesis protein CcmH/NrfF
MRAEIREALAAGKSVEEIIAGFVARVGKVVLPAPTLVGFDLAAWIAPFALLAAGLVLVSWIAVRMTRRPAAVGAAPTPAADPRVDQELRDFEEES